MIKANDCDILWDAQALRFTGTQSNHRRRLVIIE